jgi:tetratricopeptide (TPR) repeat protein
VQLRGLVARAEFNGCFGYVCGACDVGTQRWPVLVTLPSGEVKDMALKADSLACSGKVMARGGDGSLRAVAAFAGGWLTAHRPGAEVVRIKEKDVKAVRAEGVLAGVMDALGDVAAAAGGSGLAEVDEAGRLFGMHQLLQNAVRAELGEAHDDAMAALLEARCGCMGNEDRIDHRMYGVMREVVGAAGHVLGRMKAAAEHRAVWVCGMRVRVQQLAREVIGTQSLEVVALNDVLFADLSALGVVKGRPAAAEHRAMRWWREFFWGDERSSQALLREVEEAADSAPDAAAAWDCRAALARTLNAVGYYMYAREQHDQAIELYERALRIQEATLGEMHHDIAGTIRSMGASYSKKGQEDRAIELYERALRILEATVGEMHAFTALIIMSMGTSYGQKGQHDRAIERYERALRILEVTLGEMHADTALTIRSMGASYSYKGQHDRAIELFERALRIEEATLGEMHAQTAGTICSMGASYSKKGQYDRAIAETERALRICLQVLGPDHPQTLLTQDNLASIRSDVARTLSGRGRR